MKRRAVSLRQLSFLSPFDQLCLFLLRTTQLQYIEDSEPGIAGSRDRWRGVQWSEQKQKSAKSANRTEQRRQQKTDFGSLDFVVDRFFMKLFHTSNIDTVKECHMFFSGF